MAGLATPSGVIVPAAQQSQPVGVFYMLGTVSSVDGNTAQVLLDGASEPTPAQIAVAVKSGDRVRVQVSSDRTATVAANLTEPPNYSVQIGSAGFTSDGDEFVRLSPTGDTGGDGTGESFLELTLTGGRIVINGVTLLQMFGGHANLVKIPDLICQTIQTKTVVGTGMLLQDSADAEDGKTYKVCSRLSETGLSIEFKRWDFSGDETVIDGETTIAIDEAGISITTPKLTVNGKEV